MKNEINNTIPMEFTPSLLQLVKVLPEKHTHTFGTGKSPSHQHEISSDGSQCFYHNSHYLSANVHYFSLFLLHLPQNN